MTIITTGIKNAPLVSRVEIRTLLQDKDLTNLYLLALERLQKVEQQDPLSWFQISGIHGRPYVPYDNVGQKGNFGGYCTHSSILFPTWHRPYVALYEQTLAKHVVDIANEYTNPEDKKRYTAAAQRFRAPYWDWAFDSTLPDAIATQQTVTVQAPNGSHSIKNPLYAYSFHPVYSDFGDGLPDEKTWEAWQTTLRYPTSTDARGQSQPNAMEAQLRNNRFTLRDRTYNLLTQATDYVAFSNDGFLGAESDPAYYDSLEAIHGQIHGLTGRNGHMGVVDYAAFDPVFWLHHANVDRLFALWQALNPDVFVVPKESEAGTFTTRPGTIENAESPLTPFWATPGKFWTSTAVRDTRTFNYTYPELAKWSTLSPAEKRTRLRSEINRIYGKTAPVAAVVPSVFSGLLAAPGAALASVASAAQVPLKAAAPQPPAAPQSQAHAQATTKPIDANSPFEISDGDVPAWHKTVSTLDDKPHYHEWIANILVEKYAVNTTFFVHIFLGDFNPDPKQWGTDPNLVGSHVIFANNATYTGCERCRDAHERHKLVTGTIPLTGTLGVRLGAESIANLEPERIIPYLKQNLHWRIQRHDDTPIERTDVPSLRVSIGHALVDVPQSTSEFPSWGQIHVTLGVTAGRQGGATE